MKHRYDRCLSNLLLAFVTEKFPDNDVTNVYIVQSTKLTFINIQVLEKTFNIDDFSSTYKYLFSEQHKNGVYF